MSLAVVILLLLPAIQSHAATTWRTIPPEEFAADRPAGSPDAGAVVLLREVTIDNGDFDGAMHAYYVRIKVFDQKGIDALAQMQIPYEKSQRPRNIAARVVQPDGTALEVPADAIFTRDVVRVGREALRAKSFSFPGLTPGCIIEYQYKLYTDDVLLGMHLPMSQPYPVVKNRIRLKIFGIPGYSIQSIWSRQLNMDLVKERDRGFNVFEGHDVAPTIEEPMSPPDSVTKPWFSFYFTPPETDKYDFWSYEAGALAAAARELLAVKKPVKDLAMQLTAGLPDDAAKLRRLYDFCRTEIKNLTYDMSGYTPEQIEALKPNRRPTDTLKNRYGTELDINVLFGALVKALGAECSLAYCGDRSQFVFHRNLKLRGALPHIVVGIQRGGGYEFYDPGAMYLRAGQLRWMNDSTTALVIEGKFFRMIEVPGTEAEYSTTTRSARLRLSEDGTIEGDVTIALTGHDGIAAKHEYDAKTDDERKSSVTAALAERLGDVELSNFKMEHVTDPEHPIEISYHIIARGYADLTTDRIFVQSAFFQKNQAALFTAAERTNDIFFPYQYVTKDTVTIDLPAGFELEEPRAPGPVNLNGLHLYQPSIEYARRAGRLILKRDYTFNGARYAASDYELIKRSLDRVAAQDSHRLALRRVPVDAGNPAANSPHP